MGSTSRAQHKRQYDLAIERIASFSQRFDESHFLLACHAAFPLTLTPDLLYRIWAYFTPQAPWTAVADILLSRLCREVGHELFEMEASTRELLLRELKVDERFGPRRLGELADFLMEYVAYQLRSDDLEARSAALAQQWLALAFIHPGQAAHELAEALRQSLADQDTPEVIRLASLVEVFAEPLADFVPLLSYAKEIVRLARGEAAPLAAPPAATPGDVLERAHEPSTLAHEDTAGEVDPENAAELQPTTVLILTPNPWRGRAQRRLSADDWTVLTMINGKSSIEQIARRSRLDQEYLYAILTNLMQNGFVETKRETPEEELFRAIHTSVEQLSDAPLGNDKHERPEPPTDDMATLDGSTILRLVANPHIQSTELNLDSDEWRILVGINGKNNLGSIASRANLSLAKAIEIATRLLSEGLIMRHPEHGAALLVQPQTSTATSPLFVPEPLAQLDNIWDSVPGSAAPVPAPTSRQPTAPAPSAEPRQVLNMWLEAALADLGASFVALLGPDGSTLARTAKGTSPAMPAYELISLMRSGLGPDRPLVTQTDAHDAIRLSINRSRAPYARFGSSSNIYSTYSAYQRTAVIQIDAQRYLLLVVEHERATAGDAVDEDYWQSHAEQLQALVKNLRTMSRVHFAPVRNTSFMYIRNLASLPPETTYHRSSMEDTIDLLFRE